MMGWLARLFGALRLPLIRNAYALYISSLLTAGLGIFYWALATNLFPAIDVGVGATLVSTLMFVSGISELNLHSMMYRFLPRAGKQSRALVSGAYLFVLASGLILGLITGAIGILLKVMPAGITSPGVPELIAFVGSVMIWNMFSLQDSVLAAMRLSVWVPVENVVFALLKLAMLLVFVGFHPFGIFASWIVSAIAGVGVVSGLIFTMLLPRYRGGRITEPITVTGIVRYVGGDYVAGVLSTVSTSLMPILVFVLLGPLQSAYFYPVWLIAQMLRLAPLAMYSSLLVETASGHADYLRDGRRVLLTAGLTIGVPIIVLVVAPQIVLQIFGQDYAAAGAGPMRILALSVIPFALNGFVSYWARSRARMRVVIAIEAAIAAPSLILAVALPSALGLARVPLAMLIAQAAVAVVVMVMVLRPATSGWRTAQ
jgi:O-antigen/teichoic acid export membrane protein